MQSHKPTSLLGLPRELRDQIFGHIIAINQPPPQGPPFRRDRARRSPANPLLGNVEFQNRIRNPEVTALRSACQQLRSEVADLAARSTAIGHATADLDLMVRGWDLIPTFTHLPCPPELFRPDVLLDLRVILRIFDTSSFGPWGEQNQAGAQFRVLLCLLNQFLANGPNLTWPPPLGQPTRIDTLTVVLTFRDNYTPATWSAVARQTDRNLSLLAARGDVYPYIRHIVLENHSHDPVSTTEYDIERQERPGRIARWSEADFEFGPRHA